MTDEPEHIVSATDLLKVYAVAVDEALSRIAELEALILDVHEDLCCQTNYDDKIGFDKLDAEVIRMKARAAQKGNKLLTKPLYQLPN